MNRLDASAYFEATFNEVKKKHPNFGVGKTLKGIVADWSDTQLATGSSSCNWGRRSKQCDERLSG